MAARDDDSADQHRAPPDRSLQTEPAIGDPPARQAHEVDHRSIGAVNRSSCRRRQAEAAHGRRRRHIENEEAAHPVVTEALPHLGKEERRQSARMSKESAIVSAHSRGGGAVNRCAHLVTLLNQLSRELSFET